MNGALAIVVAILLKLPVYVLFVYLVLLKEELNPRMFNGRE